MGKRISDTHEWRRLEDFMEGDYIHALGNDMPVTRREETQKYIKLFYINANKEEKSIIDSRKAEYIAKKREEQ